MSNWVRHSTAETLFERLEAHGRTWKVYVQEPMALSFTGLIHMPRLKDRLATNFVPYAEFERDTAAGTLPDFSLIEPNLMAGHSDYHPACGRVLLAGVEVPADPPSSIRGGEAFLARIYAAVRSASSPDGSNAYNTTFFIGWDEPGGTYDHVPPGPVPPPDPSAPAGQMGFKFDRSGYRVPAIIVSPWVEEGTVVNEEHRHTSMIATLRKVWNLGEAFTDRDAAATPFDHLLSCESPRDPETWPHVEALPVSDFHMEVEQMGKALSTLGKAAGGGMLRTRRKPGSRSRRSCQTPTPTSRPRRPSPPCAASSPSSSPRWPAEGWRGYERPAGPADHDRVGRPRLDRPRRHRAYAGFQGPEPGVAAPVLRALWDLPAGDRRCRRGNDEPSVPRHD
jgi:phospholipase C